MRKQLFIFTCLIFISVGLFGQKVWTLEDCITYAHNNNIMVKQQKLTTQLSKEQLTQSAVAMLPNLNAGAAHTYIYGQTVDRYTNSFASNKTLSENFALNSSVTLFNGLQLLNKVLQSNLNYKASQFDLEKMKNDIALNLATAYLQILYSIEQLEVAKNQLTITNQQVEKTKKLYAIGNIAKGDLLVIESQQATEELQVVNAQNQLNLAYLSLTQMLDLPTADGFEVEKPQIAMPEASTIMQSPVDIYNQALSIQPDIKSAEIKVQSAKKGVSIAYGALSPNLSFSGSWATGYSGAAKNYTLDNYSYFPIGYTQGGEVVYGPSPNYSQTTTPFWDQIANNENKSLGFQLSIPIFNNFQVKTSISSAKINMINSQLTLQNAKNQLNKNIQQSYADALAAFNKYKATEKSVISLQEAFTYMDQKYNVGMISSYDYNDSKNKLAKAQSELLQAKYEYIFRIKILDFYQGKPITLK
jgi:outer membrane protein